MSSPVLEQVLSCDRCCTNAKILPGQVAMWQYPASKSNDTEPSTRYHHSRTWYWQYRYLVFGTALQYHKTICSWKWVLQLWEQVLLYGSEFWTLLRKHHRKLNAFHHRCLRTILGSTLLEPCTSPEPSVHIFSDPFILAYAIGICTFIDC